jgi:hypothetical protein
MYQHGKRTKQARSKAAFMATTIILSVVVLVGLYIVQKDIGNSTAPKTNVPIVTEVGFESDKNLQQISEPLFTMELPPDWKLVEKRSDQSANFYLWASTKKGADDRRLTLHIDLMPKSYKLVRLQPLIPNGTSFMLGNLSDDCIGFAGGVNASDTTPIDAKWENVSFVCDPIKNNQTIGTGTQGGSIGTKLTGTNREHTFFFFYEDHNVNPDSTILRSAITSFRAK